MGENSWILWRKLTAICWKIQDTQQLTNNFHQTGKIQKHACKALRVWTRKDPFFEDFKENFEIFWSKSLWKIDFFRKFSRNFFDYFCLCSESNTSGRELQISTTISSVSEGENIPPVTLSLRHWLRICYHGWSIHDLIAWLRSFIEPIIWYPIFEFLYFFRLLATQGLQFRKSVKCGRILLPGKMRILNSVYKNDVRKRGASCLFELF